jgi:hypothetical protein
MAGVDIIEDSDIEFWCEVLKHIAREFIDYIIIRIFITHIYLIKDWISDISYEFYAISEVL